MKRLSDLASTHKKLSFPEFPEDDDFADWVSELVEIDGYYIGHAVSLIAGGRLRAISDKELQELTDRFEQFAEIEGEDEPIYLDCKQYLSSLRVLVDECMLLTVRK